MHLDHNDPKAFCESKLTPYSKIFQSNTGTSFDPDTYRAAANCVRAEWTNESQEKYKWDQDNLDPWAIRQMDGEA